MLGPFRSQSFHNPQAALAGTQAGAVQTWKAALERSPGERHLEQALASHPGAVNCVVCAIAQTEGVTT